MPNLLVMAGPNGAGKTTTSRQILTGSRRVEEFVNADIIAAEKGLDDIAAGRLMLQRLNELTRLRKDIAFETTLSSASMRNRISAMREAGYVFHLIYVWLPSPEMSIQRVAARVRSGGHNIPRTSSAGATRAASRTCSTSSSRWPMPGRCSIIPIAARLRASRSAMLADRYVYSTNRSGTN